MPDGALRRVVGGFDAFDVDEGPQGFLCLEKFGAGTCRLLLVQREAFREDGLDARTQRTHVHPEVGTRECPVAHPVPPDEHPVRLLDELRADAARGTAALRNGREVAAEVGPAELAKAQRPEVVGAVTVRTQDAEDEFADSYLAVEKELDD